MKKYIQLFMFLAVSAGIFFSFGCASTVPFTHEVAERIGEDRLGSFQYFISDGILLRRVEVTHVGDVGTGFFRGGRAEERRIRARDEIIIRANTRCKLVAERWLKQQIVEETRQNNNITSIRRIAENILVFNEELNEWIGELWEGEQNEDISITINFRRVFDVGFEQLRDGTIPIIQFQTAWISEERFSNFDYGTEIFFLNSTQGADRRWSLYYGGAAYHLTLLSREGLNFETMPYLNIRLSARERETVTRRRVRGLRVN